MLNKIIKIMFMVIALCVINSTSAVFFTGEVLKPQLNKDDVMVIILGEFHNDITPHYAKTKEQRDNLLTFSKNNNAFLIIEDSLDYAWKNVSIKDQPKLQSIAQKLEKNNDSVLLGLNKACTDQNIANAGVECRSLSLSGRSLELEIELDKNFLNSLKICFNNDLYQKYIQEAIEQYDFYIKKLREKQSSRSVWQNTTSRAVPLQDRSIKLEASRKMLDLNVICEFHKALQTKKYSVIVIATGVGHLRNISNMIQNIFNFKSVLRKNITSGFSDIYKHGSFEKINDVSGKVLLILKEYALDLPQFFQEALKAQPIRSRL